MNVGDWLRDLGLAEFAEAFAANGVDAAILRELSNDDLKDLGVLKLADRKRLLKAIAELHEDASPGETGAAIPGGERRQVTVLFADLAGFTRLTSELGAEDIHALLNRYFEAVDACVESYGGVVDKHIGDNVMAVFGAPVAHDDDPMRAVRAALDIHERMTVLSKHQGRPLRAHIGIASGQVVASSTGSETHREYTVTGDSVNLAARLQDKAGPGETLISDAVRRSAGDRAACDSLGEVAVKGIDTAVKVWRVKGLQTAETPSSSLAFVGRNTELAQFTAVIEACRSTGRGQAIVVRGEAGIGKTRLVDEFIRTAITKGFSAHRGLVLDFGAGEGRDAIRSVAANLLGIQPGSDQPFHQRAADNAIQQGLLTADQRVFLADLLNLPLPVEERTLYDAMPNALRLEGKRKLLGELLRHVSRREPVVVVVEDIHWADPLILMHLAKLAETAAESPALLIMTSRVENYPLDQTWRAAAGGCPLMTFDLGPLRKEDAVSLASGFFGIGSELVQNCVERAAGNPLFLEHLLRNLEEHGGEEVPASIQSLVLARVDRLSATDKQALQAASVLGQRFSLNALRHLSRNSQYTCAELVQRHLVRPDGEDYLFTHALVQEGVYNSLLKARRLDLHRDSAAWFVKRDLVLCAEHLDRANDPAAARAYLDAAKAQNALFHFDTALRLAARGVELAGDPSTRCETMCLKGDALRNLGSTAESIAAFEAAVESAADDAHRCQAWIGLATGLRFADRQRAALDVLDKAEAAAASEGLVHERVQIHYLRGNVYFPLGNIDGCLTEHEKALGLARETGSTEGEALALSGLGDAHYMRGHMRTACEQFRACLKICRDNGYGRIEVANRHMIGWCRVHLMEHEEALEDALASVKLADAVSHRRAKMLGLMLAGRLEFELGSFDAASNHLQLALEIARTIGAGNFEAQALSSLAILRAEQGNMVQSRDYALSAVKVVREVGMTLFGPWTLAVTAAVAEDRSESKHALAEAESILDSGCVAHNHFWFAQTAIDHALENGEWDDAERYAARLETYTRTQPLPGSDFLIARGRALAAWGRGRRGDEVESEVKRLHSIAVQQGLKPVAAGLVRALQSPVS